MRRLVLNPLNRRLSQKTKEPLTMNCSDRTTAAQTRAVKPDIKAYLASSSRHLSKCLQQTDQVMRRFAVLRLRNLEMRRSAALHLRQDKVVALQPVITDPADVLRLYPQSRKARRPRIEPITPVFTRVRW